LDIAPAAGFPVVLAFHGGGEDVHTDTDTGFADYSGLSSLSAVVVFITGQVSGNGQTWNSAFPWMDRPTPQDDAALVETILGDLANQVPKGTSLDMSRIYTVGKSDGAGMATSLLCTNTGKFKFTAAASISGAHFGVNSATNFGTSRAQICLPKAAVPVLFVHGTGDTVTPYQGQNFVTAKALEASQKYWVTIDGAVTTTSSNTYTASMKDYVQAWATQANGCGAVPAVSTISSASTLTSFSGCKATIAAITIANGEHVWLGHAKSGPKSGQDPNMDFDVTPVIAAFFKIDVSRYTPTQALPQSVRPLCQRRTQRCPLLSCLAPARWSVGLFLSAGLCAGVDGDRATRHCTRRNRIAVTIADVETATNPAAHKRRPHPHDGAGGNAAHVAAHGSHQQWAVRAVRSASQSCLKAALG
jgi:polyhydroxybutyrate depolymerase